MVATAQQCDRNRPCGDNMCCSQWGYCGCSADYCGNGCQSQCNWCSGGGGGGNGEATFYTEYVPSACYGFDRGPFPAGNLIAAASPDIFNGLCGAYFDITCKGAVSGAGGCRSNDATVTVRVVDLCPGCHANSFDLSYEAFTRIANPDVGRIRIFSQRKNGAGIGQEFIAQVVGSTNSTQEPSKR
nr:EG45-like domain containing protein [Selaginella moellendorffii]